MIESEYIELLIIYMKILLSFENKHCNFKE